MSSRSRVKPSLRTPTTPSQFFPPSYFAAAAGVPYPTNRDETPTLQQDQCYPPFSSNASYLVTEHTDNPSRARRKSQLGDLEPQLLPTLNDTIERMTRPPSQVVSSSPFCSASGPASSPSSVARTPSTSSQGSSAYSVGNCSISSTIQPQLPLRSPLIVNPEQSTRSSSSRSPNPKSILKSHSTCDRHQVRKNGNLDDIRLPTDHHARKSSRSPIPIPPEPMPSESRIEHTRQLPTSPRPKVDASIRTGRARSRTDPGTVPKGLPSTHGKNVQQTQHSGIPRRVGMPPSPATTRTPTTAQVAVSGSDAASMNSIHHEKRRLFVTNAEISSSSSTDSQAHLTRYIKSKTLSRTDSQSSTESQLRPPRFGLGLGLSGVNEPKNSVKLSPGQRWTAKIPSNEAYLFRPNSKRHRDKRRDRSPSRNARADIADGQRRQRELLSLMHADLNDSSGCDSQPSSSSEGCLASDGSGDSLRSAFDDSGSEYSPTEVDAHETRRDSTRWEIKFEHHRKATARQGRANIPGELPMHADEQYTPRASSIASYPRHNNGQIQSYPATAASEEDYTESSTVVSEQDAYSIDETVAPGVPPRYSSELSRIMAASIAAAERQRQAFGIGSSSDSEEHQANSSQLRHADSDISLIGGHEWQDEYDELATGSLLQQLDRPCGTDGRKDVDRPSSADALSLSSGKIRSSVSEESIYSALNSSTRRSSRGIVVQESPSATPTVRDQQWQTLERHVLDSYGEVEVRRQRLVWEFTETEDYFVTQLQNMIQLFILPLRVRDTRLWVSGIPSDVTNLFDWLEDIVRVHAQLSSMLVARQIVDHPRLQTISEIFRGFVPRLETYQPYLVKLEFTASVIESLIQEGKDDFGDFIKLQEASERCQGWDLEKYLIEPVNRLAQYPEVFRRLLQLTPKSHPDYMSTLSLVHAAKLTIRVLSEVKDREDAYELVKMVCSGIQGISSAHLVRRERRLLIRGSLTCVQVSNDEQALEPPAESQTPLRSDGRRIRRTDRLSKAISVWRGRSNSIKSTASTVVSFSTAPSSFDVQLAQLPLATPVVRIESEPIDAEVLVFSDLVLLALRCDSGGGDAVDACELDVLNGYGLSRIVSVLDEIDRRACITLDLAPLTTRALEEGYVQSTGPVVTIALSRPRPRSHGRGHPNARHAQPLSDWLAPLRRSCQHTHRALSSLNQTHMLVDRAAAHQPVVSSILAAGLPLPKSPSMQIQESECGLLGDSERLEREERGWWSKRFHEVFAELSAQESGLC